MIRAIGSVTMSFVQGGMTEGELKDLQLCCRYFGYFSAATGMLVGDIIGSVNAMNSGDIPQWLGGLFIAGGCIAYVCSLCWACNNPRIMMRDI